VSDRFEELLNEVRTDLGSREVKSVDWEAVDAKLFARIDDERRAERARFAPQRRRGLAMTAAGVAAAAAVLAFLVGKARDNLDAEGVVASVPSAGNLVAIEGPGAVLVDGKPATGGTSLHLGDVLETTGTRATVERPGKLTLSIEPETRAVVTHVRGALVLALERGAVEAQVVPVPAGEAFAVDVDGARVAVHGTHLRVARAGERVFVDLNEGVVAVGEAPREGSVLGTLVNAPAHVEFVATNPEGTLTQTHDPKAVRAPELHRTTEPSSHAVVSSHTAAPPTQSTVPVTSEPRAEVHPLPGAASKPASAAPTSSPEAAIGAAVRSCMAERPRSDNVTVVVSTTLHLDLGDDGSVRAARFDPPVAPDVNACAAAAIYRERFAHSGSVAISIDFKN
jgi:ferric-dicitrate binding protein FerR (iron transport regulator)